MTDIPDINLNNVAEYIESLEPLEIEMLFHLNSFDDEDGGYSKLETLAKLAKRPEEQVEKALQTLVSRDLADFGQDLDDNDGEPWGDGYARFEDGEQLMSGFCALQDAEQRALAKYEEKASA